MVAAGVVTPEDIILEQMSAGDGVALVETSDLGLPDRTMATYDATLPTGGIFLEQTLARGGSRVEWRVAFRVDNGAYQRLGATESRRRT
jgi:hypothetical protein